LNPQQWYLPEEEVIEIEEEEEVEVIVPNVYIARQCVIQRKIATVFTD